MVFLLGQKFSRDKISREKILTQIDKSGFIQGLYYKLKTQVGIKLALAIVSM